jgi:hypothetical protein
VIGVGHLRYHEVDELKAGMKRNLGDRRLRVANNIRVRRAARAISKASDVHELFDAIEQMLEFGQFAFASAAIGRAGDAEVNEHAFKAGAQRTSAKCELRGGRINWNWHLDGENVEDVDNSIAYWSLRLRLGSDERDLGWINFYRQFDADPLLVDTNYIVGLFRAELTRAAERILTPQIIEPEIANLAITVNTGKITP